MNGTLNYARQISLALLVVTTLNYGHCRMDYAGTAPNSLGLIRLGRDISRRASKGEILESPGASALRTGQPGHS
jgi:hypothetical protein